MLKERAKRTHKKNERKENAMGITIKEVLNLPVVRHSKLLAGFDGRERIVDGIALLESTDSTRWLTKNCLILTNAQLLKDNPEWASRLIHTLHQKTVPELP